MVSLLDGIKNNAKIKKKIIKIYDNLIRKIQWLTILKKIEKKKKNDKKQNIEIKNQKRWGIKSDA